MLRKPKRRNTTWRATVRVVAVMFLLLAGADLAFPQLCAEDSETMLASQTVSPASLLAGSSGGPGHEQPHQASTEDCFCCCSHIVSEDSDSPLGALAMVIESGLIVPSNIPLAPLELLFHPPRLA